MLSDALTCKGRLRMQDIVLPGLTLRPHWKYLIFFNTVMLGLTSSLTDIIRDAPYL